MTFSSLQNDCYILTEQLSPENPGMQEQVYPEVELSGVQVAPLLQGLASHVET